MIFKLYFRIVSNSSSKGFYIFAGLIFGDVFWFRIFLLPLVMTNVCFYSLCILEKFIVPSVLTTLENKTISDLNVSRKKKLGRRVKLSRRKRHFYFCNHIYYGIADVYKNIQYIVSLL